MNLILSVILAVALQGFSISEVPDSVFASMRGKSYKENCTVDIRELRYLKVLHKDKDGNTHAGELVVNKAIADDVLEIFKELYNRSYPIERVSLIDNYGADDELSMEENNSSSFNFRLISGTTKVSKHGSGMAVDINPLYNPYVKGDRFEPENAAPYLDRNQPFPYKITAGDDCVRLFKAHGFTWGGDWKSCKDYQHFER